MRVHVQGQFLVPGKVGGAEEYLHALVLGLLQCRTRVRISLRRCALSRFSDLQESFPDLLVRKTVPDWGPRFLWETLEAATLDDWPEVLLCPNYFRPPVHVRVPTAVVIHDTNHVALPENWRAAKRAWLTLCHRWALQTAGRVITVSAFSRDEISAAYPTEPTDTIRVAPNPIDWDALAGRPAESSAPEAPYFLTVGSHYPHKNLGLLAEAFRVYRDQGGDHRWVVAGQLPDGLRGHGVGYPALARADGTSGSGGWIDVRGRVPQAELVRLLKGASALVMPSLYEGFGRPAVEALGLGTPVICSCAGALPEVTGGAARLVGQPTSRDAWVEALKAGTVVDPVATEKIRERFSAGRVAERYLTLFVELV